MPADASPSPGPLRESPSRGRLLLGSAIALVSLAVILRLTLTPASTGSWVSAPIHCVICGPSGLANLLRNILLFMPLGAGLGLALRRPVVAWLLTVALTAFIELHQFDIPGRNPLLIDFATNAMGGGLGVIWARGILRSRARGLVIAWVLVVATGLLGSAVAFRADWPGEPWFMQWTARLGHFEAYDGRILGAKVGERSLPPGRSGETAAVQAALEGGDTLEVRFELGTPPRALAPILSIYNADREEVLVLGRSGDDLVLRLPYRAAALTLDQPDHRVRGALEGLQAGDTATLHFVFRSDGACFGLVGEMRCDIRPHVGMSWALLLFPGEESRGVIHLLGIVWLLGLSLPVGLLASSWREAGAAAGAIGAAALLAPLVPGTLAALSLSTALVLVGGVLAGHGLRPLVPGR